jgi:hypothetical protein
MHVTLLKERLLLFALALNTKWDKSGRSEHYFLKINEAWLNLEFIFPDAILDEISDVDITAILKNCLARTNFYFVPSGTNGGKQNR